MRLARVVDDILTLAEIESLETPFTRVDVNDVVDDAAGRVAVGATEAGVAIGIDHADRNTCSSVEHHIQINCVIRN